MKQTMYHPEHGENDVWLDDIPAAEQEGWTHEKPDVSKPEAEKLDKRSKAYRDSQKT